MSTPEQQGLRKADQQLTRSSIELKKNEAIAASEDAGYMQKLAASLNILRIQYRMLNEEEFKGAKGRGMLKDIQEVDAEIKKLDSEMGNHQRKVGDYASAFDNVGEKLQQFIVRDLFKATASIIVYTALFEGVSKLGQLIIQSIPGTEAYEQEQARLLKVNEDLAKSFEDLVSSMLKLRESTKYNSRIYG